MSILSEQNQSNRYKSKAIKPKSQSHSKSTKNAEDPLPITYFTLNTILRDPNTFSPFSILPFVVWTVRRAKAFRILVLTLHFLNLFITLTPTENQSTVEIIAKPTQAVLCYLYVELLNMKQCDRHWKSNTNRKSRQQSESMQVAQWSFITTTWKLVDPKY